MVLAQLNCADIDTVRWLMIITETAGVDLPFVVLLLVVLTYLSPSFLAMSLGMAFLLTMKSIHLATMKFSVMYHVPL